MISGSFKLKISPLRNEGSTNCVISLISFLQSEKCERYNEAAQGLKLTLSGLGHAS